MFHSPGHKQSIVTVVIISLAVLIYIANRSTPDVVLQDPFAPEPAAGPGRVDPPQAQTEEPVIEQTEAGFSDGDTVTINWRDSPDRTFLFPNGTPLENYEYYKVLAESDVGLAAYQLANMMSSCSHTYLSRSELDTAIKQMRETFTYYDPELDAQVRLGEPEDVERSVQTSTTHFENCKDFSAEQRGEHQRWMELAANNGHTTAMLDYGRTLDDPVASVALYRSAWQQGDAGALHSLAEGLEAIYDQGIDPTAKVPAYAAMHAFATIMRQTAYGSDPDRIIGRQTSRDQAKLDQMTKEMLPHELGAALDLSKSMIVSNENCCFEM